jgi:hypothetical protein
MTKLAHSMRFRALIFAALIMGCVVTMTVYVAWVLERDMPLATTTAPADVPVSASDSSAPRARPYILFRNTTRDVNFGAVALVPLNAPEGPRTMTGLRCERVYFAAGQGLCLTADRRTVTSYSAITFGADFSPRHTFQLSGIPSRARVSPDGRYAAYTIFTSGHSYDAGSFSTRTVLIDMARDSEITDLEQFEVWRDGQVIRAQDFNFWGVTFAQDSKRFYSTLSTAGKSYLIEGYIPTRTARVLYNDVQCPSLSPDNTHIAFKRLTSSGWRLHVLDLTTMTDIPLVTETRSVDDQVEWLDDRHVLYTPMVHTPTGENVWSLATDGSEPPQLLLSLASSPAVVRSTAIPPLKMSDATR